MALGPKDLSNNTIEVARRDTLEKETLQIADIDKKVSHLLNQIQENLYKKALTNREEKTYVANNLDEFKKYINQGGFVYAHWDGTNETEEKIKATTKATIRCIPLDTKAEKGKCIFSQADSARRVLFAKAY